MEDSLNFWGRLISFVIVSIFTFVLIAYYAIVSRDPECHTEIVPEGYNNQTETWTERQEIEVCEDPTWDKAILLGVALFIGTLLLLFMGLVVLSHVSLFLLFLLKPIFRCCGLNPDDW